MAAPPPSPPRYFPTSHSFPLPVRTARTLRRPAASTPVSSPTNRLSLLFSAEELAVKGLMATGSNRGEIGEVDSNALSLPDLVSQSRDPKDLGKGK
ncbi:hypothetical protein E2562_034696 [Oryza meyeriana var. granulata]|uniref:Uncharacterized protein n=1 Tax=Oryza meyeriana var. granulata TaxID=110450 RepID=A0A6G1C108_9ORYZ|nr:hypothetical protein E2562_034696 [Oryza meyeriana var. granulata]